MARHMEIELEGFKVVATLLDDEAPKTCDAFWNILPFEGEAMHCTCSGQCIFSHGGSLPKVEPENQSPFVSQGDVLISPDLELIIVHGRMCYIRAYTTNDYPVNHFAIIQDIGKFEEVAENLKRVGAKKILIRRI